MATPELGIPPLPELDMPRQGGSQDTGESNPENHGRRNNPDSGRYKGRRKRRPIQENQDAARARAIEQAQRLAQRPFVAPEETESLKYVDADKLEDGRVYKIDEVATEIRSVSKKFNNETILDKDPRVAQAVSAASIGVVTSMAAAVMMGFGKPLAVGVGVYTLRKPILMSVDYVGRGFDKLGDRLLNWGKAGVPWPLKNVANGLGKMMDRLAKKFGIDKSLREHLKKNKEDRKKLSAKLLKELSDEEKAHEKKVDSKKSREKRKNERDRRRFERLSRMYGPDTAYIMVYEDMDELERELEIDEAK